MTTAPDAPPAPGNAEIRRRPDQRHELIVEVPTGETMADVEAQP